MHYLTSSPELNPAENAQNQLRQVVQTMLKEGSIKWTEKARDKMKQLRKALLGTSGWVRMTLLKN
jgi:hypothetical protein